MMSASRIRRCVPRYSTGISPRSVMFRRYVCEIPASSAARDVVSISSTLLTVTASPRLKRPSRSTTASRAAGGSRWTVPSTNTVMSWLPSRAYLSFCASSAGRPAVTRGAISAMSAS